MKLDSVYPHIYESIPGWFFWQELYDRAVRLARPGGKLVEIGCFKGRSTSYLAAEILRADKGLKLYAIDLWDEKGRFGVSQKEFLENVKPVSSVIEAIQIPSISAAKLFQDGSLDFIWIDGDHSFPGVTEDIYAWYPKLRLGGWMGGDDLCIGGVRKAVERAFGPEKPLGKKTQGNWIRYQSPLIYDVDSEEGICPNSIHWVWWTRSKSKDWTILSPRGKR